MTAPSPALSRPASALVHGAFVLTGVATTMLGPLLPWLSSQWELGDRGAGALFTAQFVGAMLGIAIAGPLVPRAGFRLTLVLGILVMAAASAALAVDWRGAGVLCVLCNGVGVGIAIPATNLLVAEANPDRRAAALSYANLAWGAGAVACAPILAAVRVSLGTRGFLACLAAALFVSGIGLALSLPGNVRSADVAGASAAGHGSPLDRLAIALGALFFVYVGTEAAVSGWVATHAQRLIGQGRMADLMPSFFWAPLLGGRAVAPVALRYLSEGRLVAGSSSLAGAGCALLLAAPTPVALALGVGLAGLGMAPIFPILVAWVTRSYGTGSSRISSGVFGLASVGGATLPWLVGVVSSWTGSLRAGLVLPLLGVLGMLALQRVALRASAPPGDR